MKKLLILLGLLLTFPAYAVDNTVIVTPGIGVTMKSKDIGAGVQAMQPVLSDTTGAALSTPTAGADAVSNTSTGLLGYSRMQFYNGTTWDRWQGAIKAASGAFASGSIASGAVASGAMVDLGAQADAACGTDNGTCSAIALIKRTNQNVTTLNTTAGAAVPTGANVIGQVGQVSQYPFGAVPITISATGTTGATTATLAASASIKTYICGFSIRANATAAATANSTITGTVTGTLNYTQWTAPNASGIGITEQIFAPCIPSSAINTAIAVISAAPGTGGVVSVSAWGYQL